MRRCAHRHPAGPLLLALLLAGCGGGHRLAEHDFAQGTLAVVYPYVPRPELRTGPLAGSDDADPLRMVIGAGAQLAKEVEGRRARSRLDSAAVRVDVGGRMAARTLERASRYLATRPVADPAAADYLLELDLESLGIDAGRGQAAHLFVNAQVILLEARTGHEIWSEDVRAWSSLGPGVAGGGDVSSDVMATGALGAATVADFERMLARLADYAADRMTRELREELRDTRRRGP